MKTAKQPVMTKRQILDAAMRLGTDDRIDLADELFASVESREQGEIDRAWDEEIKSRIDDVRHGRVKPIPANEAINKLRAKYRK
jgi:putative addiction module component (TIGR02574 family)